MNSLFRKYLQLKHKVFKKGINRQFPIYQKIVKLFLGYTIFVALLIKLFLDHYKPQLNKNYLQSIKTIQISKFLSTISRAIPSKRKLRDSSSIMPSMMKKIYLPVSQRNSHLPKRELDMDPLSKALQHLYSDLQPEKASNKIM